MTALSLAQDPYDFEQTAFTVTPLAPGFVAEIGGLDLARAPGAGNLRHPPGQPAALQAAAVPRPVPDARASSATLPPASASSIPIR